MVNWTTVYVLYDPFSSLSSLAESRETKLKSEKALQDFTNLVPKQSNR